MNKGLWHRHNQTLQSNVKRLFEDAANDPVHCDLRYQGQLKDKESELYYNLNRYYDADSGQYLSSDPIGMLGGLRPQAYVHNPMEWVDPLGLAGASHGGTGQDRRNYLNEKFGRTGNLHDDINQRGSLSTTYSSPSRNSSAKRPGGYHVYDTDAHGNLSPGRNRASGHKNNSTDNLIQSHHAIQHEWAKINVPGYNRNQAPAVLLPSSSGLSHAKISSYQRNRRLAEGFNTDIKYEFQVSYVEMINAGVPMNTARRAIRQSFKYYDNLGAFK